MKAKRLVVTSDLVASVFATGNEIHARVKAGLPLDAVLHTAQWSGREHATVNLVFTSREFEDVPTDTAIEDLPIHQVVMERLGCQVADPERQEALDELRKARARHGL